jgi:dihydrofolate reductase
MNEKPKAVFSRTLERAEWGPAEIFGGDLAAEIANLKARDDQGTVLVHGGPDFATSLTRLGLVDEYQLTTVPIAIGAGRPGARRRPGRCGRGSRAALWRWPCSGGRSGCC